MNHSRLSAALFASALIGVVRAPRASAQSAPRQSFDVVSIKPSISIPRDRSQFECDHGRFVSRGAPLLWAIDWAYNLNDYQVSPGWPAWLNSFGTFDIEAKTDNPVSQDQCKLMVQSLFEDRFKMRVRMEVKNVPAYALMVGKNGPKVTAGGKVIINGELKQAASEHEPPEGWTMARLANYLASVRGVDRPVVDKTGLAGIYGLKLDYSTADGDGRADIRTALLEEIGLRLQAVKAPIAMFVIDHIENPSGN